MAPPDGLVTALPALLATLDRPGDYDGTGAVELPVVRIAVDSVGVLGLPVPRTQAEALRTAAQDAPYGRGPRTLVDTSVRRCGQLGASAVHADDSRGRATLQRIVDDATKALGGAGKVSAELYKLLVYGPGDFFVEHRDTEKSPGMFATLVVALPSPHTGGALVVRHEGREAVIDLGGEDLGVARWTAFYCDCQHELQPLRAGPAGRARAPDGRGDRPAPRRVRGSLRDAPRAPAGTTGGRGSRDRRAQLHLRRLQGAAGPPARREGDHVAEEGGAGEVPPRRDHGRPHAPRRRSGYRAARERATRRACASGRRTRPPWRRSACGGALGALQKCRRVGRFDSRPRARGPRHDRYRRRGRSR